MTRYRLGRLEDNKLPKLTSNEIERRWFEVWEGWPAEDRAAAIKVLQRLQERMKPEPKPEPKPEQAKLPGVTA